MQIFSSVLSIFGQNHLSLGMFGNVIACLFVVCRVYTYRNAASHQGTVESEEPLWSVETDYVEHGVLGHVVVEE